MTIVPRDNCFSIPLHMVICKKDGPPDYHQGDGEALIVANNHLDDSASSVPLQIIICREDGPPDDQNQGDGGAQIVQNNHPDDPTSSVLFRSFANGL